MADEGSIAVAGRPYSRTIYARWGDMDFNAHMRNTAYLDASGDLRMSFFADHGFTMPDFQRLQIGPVILRDVLEYYRELHLLEEVEVQLELMALSEDGSHWRMRNDFRREDGQQVARVESTGGWLDLRARRLVEAPPELGALLHAMPRTADFATIDSVVRR